MRRDILVSIFGIGAGQFIVLAAMPLLARSFTPAEFGVFAVVSALAGVISTIATLRLDAAIPAAGDDDVGRLATAAIMLPFIVVPLVVLALAIVPITGDRGNWAAIVDHRWAIISIGTLQGLVAVGTALCIRFGDFGFSAAIRVAQPAGFIVVALLAVDSLVVAYAVGWLSALLIAGGLQWKRVALHEWRSVRMTLKQWWRFPALSSPVTLLDALTLSLPLLFIASSYDEESAGNYSQVQRLVGAPLTIIATAVGQVFYKHAGELHRGANSVRPLMWRTVRRMTALAIIATAAVYAIGDPVLSLVLGEGWRTDKQFVTLALLPIALRVVVSPVSTAFIAVGRLGLGAAWQVSYFVVTFAVLFWAQNRFEITGFLLALVASELCLYVAYLALGHMATGVEPASSEKNCQLNLSRTNALSDGVMVPRGQSEREKG